MVATNHELDAPPWKRVETTLIATARAIRRASNARFAHLDLNITQVRLLAYLDERGPLSQTQHAAGLGMGRAATGLVINSLEGRALVERRDDPVDRRDRLIALEPAGCVLISPIQPIDERLRSELRAGISRTERHQLAGLSLRLQSNLATVLEGDEA